MNESEYMELCISKALYKNTGSNFYCSSKDNCFYCLSNQCVFVFNQEIFTYPNQISVQIKIDSMLNKNGDVITDSDTYYFDKNQNLIRIN